MQPITMDRLGKALDRESYEYLAAHAPDILEAVEAEVGAGRQDEEGEEVIERLTYNLNEMIYHQRQAAALPAEAEYHQAEATRYRLVAVRLERQQRITRQLLATWVSEN